MPEERKLVTILFADVTGSTELGESLDPEDVRALMGRYYAHAQRVISQHGGTLEKFIGDAVMAVLACHEPMAMTRNERWQLPWHCARLSPPIRSLGGGCCSGWASTRAKSWQRATRRLAISW